MNRLLWLLLVLTLMLPGIALVACENEEEEATSALTPALTATPRAAPTPRVTATLEATPTAEKTAPSEVTSTPKATPQLTPTEESLTADELIARAYEAMTEESFALDVPPEPPVPALGQPPYSITFGPPDVLLIAGRGYEYWPYILLVGNETRLSETGRQWMYFPATENQQFFRLWYDPRELLRIATDIRDEGTEEINGGLHRVVAARADVAKFFDKYPADAVELDLTVDVLGYYCPDCPLVCDTDRLESLGYRTWAAPTHLFKGRDIYIRARADKIRFEVQGVRELSPALESEFREVMEACSFDPGLLDGAETRIYEVDGQLAGSNAPDEVRFWIDLETLLVSKMEPDPRRDSMDELVFIDYGKVELPEPEPSLPHEEADALSNEVEAAWEPLAEALEAYARSHDGLYPDELTPGVLEEALESEGLEWPENPLTTDPMKESPEGEAGDFHYQASPDGLQYCAEVYPWGMRRMPVGPPGPLGSWPTPCPTPTPSSP